MSEIIAFTRARLDEDAAAARDIAAKVAADPGSIVEISLAHPELAAGDCPSYLGEYDPARVLAQVAAMRAIVGLHPEMLGFCQGCASERFPCRTRRHLAAIWRGHPDFDPAWAPDA